MRFQFLKRSYAQDAHGQQPARSPQSQLRWIVLCAVALMGAIAVGTAVTVATFREDAIERNRQGLESSVLLLAQHFDQYFEDFGIPQANIVAQLESQSLSADAFQSEMGTLAVHELLRGMMSGWTDVAGANLFDSHGKLINSSQSWPVENRDISDRTYFKEMRFNASTTLAVEVVMSRFSSSYAIVFARRVSGPDGEFLGLVTRAIKPVVLESYFESARLGPQSSISMHHKNGPLLARFPQVDALLGRNFKTGSAEQQAFFEQPKLTGRLASPIDHRDRLISAHMLKNLPIVIIATKTTDAVLANWRSQTRFFIAVAVTSLIVIATMLSLMIRQIRRQHRASQRQLRAEKQRLDTAINNMTQGLLLFDSAQRLIVCNQRYIEMYGLSPEVIKPGCSFHEVIQHRKVTGSFPGDVDEYCAKVLNRIQNRTSSVVEAADGRLIQIVNEPVADGGWLATHEDVTDRLHAEEKIAYLAHYDALTDLPNRTRFTQEIEHHLAKLEAGHRFAILYIDIDGFKGVNDSLGHQAGDDLLRQLARRLKTCVGQAGMVARLGGDEFAIVQPHVDDRTDVTDLIERVQIAVRVPVDCLGDLITTDASIGVAMAPTDGSNLEQLMKNADLAMYSAKADGRRTFRFFDPEMLTRMEARRALESDLRQALARGEFSLHYQPLVDLLENEVVGCEALLRWQHPQRGIVSPAAFIPIAEDSGMIFDLGNWVIKTACAEAATWPNNITIAVNVSPVQFKSGSLALNVARALSESGLAANRLELEITEAVLIEDDEQALASLHQLRGLGVRIALDDFGTGYSALSYLQRFPFDKIKIDRCFISDIGKAGGTLAIVQAVINMALAGNMSTTAEGVETEEQRDILRKLGCTQMQGFLFSPARPAQEIKRSFFSRRRSGMEKSTHKTPPAA